MLPSSRKGICFFPSLPGCFRRERNVDVPGRDICPSPFPPFSAVGGGKKAALLVCSVPANSSFLIRKRILYISSHPWGLFSELSFLFPGDRQGISPAATLFSWAEKKAQAGAQVASSVCRKGF